MKNIVLFVLSILATIGCLNIWNVTYASTILNTTIVNADWVLYTNGPNLDEIMNSNASLFIIDYSSDGTDKKAFTKTQIDNLRNSGKTILAYLNVGAAENWRYYWKKLDKGIILSPLQGWQGEYYVKYWYDSWISIVKEYLGKIVNAGFDGVMFDWVNIYMSQTLQIDTKKSQRDLKYAMADTLRKVVSTYPNLKYAFVNGDDLLVEFPDLIKYVRYVVVESVFFSNLKSKVGTQEFENRIKTLTTLTQQNVIVLSVEYIDNGNPLDKENASRIKDYIRMCKGYGFLYYIAKSNQKLDTINVPKIPKE
ncbi:MAG: endo alpha-1,4 polygalactosaminidase [Fervidobacterium sp.]